MTGEAEMVDRGLVGQLIEQRYRVEALIGRGAMGTVYRARDVAAHREVAIKVLHRHLARVPAMVARFEREAAVMARLQHPNLVEMHGVGRLPSGQRWMALELVRGESLASMLTAGPLERARVIHLVRGLLRGLAHAHAAGLVHRDLKPENVIVEHGAGGAEVPRIVDFGIAVLCDPGAPGRAGGPSIAVGRITETGIVLGTPAYMAPEQARGGDPDPRTDLFALGVMTYEMLAGVHPFDGRGAEVIFENATRSPPPIRRRAPDADADPLLEALARRLMARELADRFPSAAAALDALDLIERDRDAAVAALDIVAALDLTDTLPLTRRPARRAAPRPSERAPVSQAPAVERASPPAPAPGRARGAACGGRPTLLGCAVFLGAAALGFALIAG
jgi:serine/threonine protein kinase